MKSPVKSLTDVEYTALPPDHRALFVARSLVGVKEHGHNRGTWVERFLRVVGLGPGYAWCAAFVAYCLKEAGCAEIPKGGGAVRNWAKWAAEKVLLCGQPERGRLFYWLDGATGHIGFCLGRLSSTGTFRTLEGNTNSAGSRDGDGVHEKVRSLAELKRHQQYGFIDLRKK